MHDRQRKLLENQMWYKSKEGYDGSFASIIQGIKTTAKYNATAVQQAFDNAAKAK